MNGDRPSSWRSRVPSFVWLIIFAGGIVLAIGTIVGLFYGLAAIPGFASIIFLLIGFFVIRNTGSSMGNAAMIGFFALMGVAVDQPGNPIYNVPVGIWQCPDGTELNRGINVTNPLPERTDITQDFSCVDDSGEVVKRIGMEYVALVRLIEYVLIGYLFMGINGIRRRLRGGTQDDDLIVQAPM
jgi:hypothetical protein